MPLTGRLIIYKMDKFVFGITGPTGAGKSTVSEIFRHCGAFVIDADIAAREVMKKGSPSLDEIRKVFGNLVFCADGKLNRPELAKIVFNDKTKLKLLNSVTHKYIKKYIENEIHNCPADIVAIDGAVIIGSPVMDMCRLLVVVTADDEVRINRIMKRDSINYDSALARINSQMSNKEYESYGDFIIKNNDDNVRLEECVEDIYGKIKNFSASASPTQAKAKP